ncbi:MAG: SEC-C metal-binding domain-containing protein [Elusimicrobiales bacterium]|nr:SEC-C metal-binding domain-containing protein [Elusimicrobiales bacterium]
MAWDFIKKLVGKEEEKKHQASPGAPAFKPQPAAHPAEAPAKPVPPKAEAVKAAAPAKPAAPAKEKPHAEKTDDELAAELDKMSPQILAQAKDPQMKALIIGIYRKMLVAGVDVSDDKAVKKWMQRHPEVMNGGETVKVETIRREEPKVGRNDACPCGSGKKYKKCHGAGK